MASFKASHPKRHDLTLARTGGERRSLDVRAQRINVSSGPSKEIAGLKKMKMMTPGSHNPHVWEFSYEALKVRRGPLGLCVGTYGPLECFGEFLKPS